MSASDVDTSKNEGTHTSRLWVDPLSAPGPDSNYLDWAFIVELHLRSVKLGHVLKPSLPKEDQPKSWVEDNVLACATMSQAVSAANIKYIRKAGREADAAAMWRALQVAHEDHTSGGRIHWLYKLILMQMTDGEDIKAHLDKIHKAYKRLNALITQDRPLTADDIYATALVISLPPEWMTSILHLMQLLSTTSQTIISALQNKSNYRKTRQVDLTTEVSAAKASTSSSKTTPLSDIKSTRCSFCNRRRHSLDNCNTARKILNQARTEFNENRRNTNDDSSSRSKSRSQPSSRTKAGKAMATVLESSEDDEDYDSSDIIACLAKAISSTTTVKKSKDSSVDSGCSKLMTPHKDQLVDIEPRHVPIKLADDSIIQSTHLGSWKLPFTGNPTHDALYVPSLQEPLLSVSGVCDEGMTVVFDRRGCKFYPEGTLSSNSKPIGVAERRGGSTTYLMRYISRLSPSMTRPLTYLSSIGTYPSVILV